MSFCALCTSDIEGRAKLAPFGRGGAWVSICKECDVGPIVAKRGPDVDPQRSSVLGASVERFRAIKRRFIDRGKA